MEVKPGVRQNVEIFFTPYLTEACAHIIENNPDLLKLYEAMLNSENPLEHLIMQQMLDSLVGQYIVDSDQVASKTMYASEFWNRYHVGHDEFRSGFADNLDAIMFVFEESRPINYTGNMVFVDSEDTYLVKDLKDHNFVHLGRGDMISIDKQRVIYTLRNNGKSIIASTGFALFSPKKRHTTDNIFEGFDPNFFNNVIYDLATTRLEYGLGEARRLLEEFIDGFEEMPIEAFFMTLQLGHDLDKYSITYRSNKRYKIADFMDLEEGQKEVIVVESDGQDGLCPRIVDISNEKSWSDLRPHMDFYKRFAISKTRNLYKLCKALGIEDVIDSREEEEFYDFPEQLSLF